MDSLGLIGLTWIHVASLHLTYLAWTPLKPQQITVKTKLAGRLRAGVPGQRRMRRITQKLHQDMPEHIETQPEQTRTHPASQVALQELMEALKSLDHITKSGNVTKGTGVGTGEPRRTIHSWEAQRREHHRLTGTHSFASHARNETISRLSSPQPPIVYERAHEG